MVITVIDINAELAKLTMLRGRTPTTTEEQRKGAFARLAPYRDSAISAAKFAGNGAWERHLNGDEIVHVIDGAATLHLLTAAGRQSIALKAGTIAIVPQATWHRFEAPDGVTLLATTPQPTEHLRVEVDDPRTVLS